jgi:hypothetical protein
MVDLSPEMCRGLPKMPCIFNSSELLFVIAHRILGFAAKSFLRLFWRSNQKATMGAFRNIF